MSRIKAHRILLTKELPPGSRTVIRVEGRELVVMNLDGVLRAIRNRCAHQGGPLGEGPITRTIAATEHTDWDPETCFEARVVRCPWHSLEYDLDTGLAIGNPRYRVKVYEVRIRGDFLEILL